MNKVLNLDTVDSTNKYAKKHFALLADGTLIKAKEQTKGKGRNGKVWHSPHNSNLYASYIMKNINFLPYKASWIGGLAAIQTINNISEHLNCWLKWPNDVFIANKKIAGVLCETSTNNSNKVIGVIIGIGININMSKNILKQIDKPATSVLAETDRIMDIDLFAVELHKNLNSLYNKVTEYGIDSIFRIWKKENKLIGKQVEILQDNNNIISVQVIDIDNTGELVVIDNKANISRIYSGDVSIKKFTY